MIMLARESNQKRIQAEFILKYMDLINDLYTQGYIKYNYNMLSDAIKTMDIMREVEIVEFLDEGKFRRIARSKGDYFLKDRTGVVVRVHTDMRLPHVTGVTATGMKVDWKPYASGTQAVLDTYSLFIFSLQPGLTGLCAVASGVLEPAHGGFIALSAGGIEYAKKLKMIPKSIILAFEGEHLTHLVSALDSQENIARIKTKFQDKADRAKANKANSKNYQEILNTRAEKAILSILEEA